MAEPAEPENHQGPDAKAAAKSARVFISYASQDKGVADVVCLALEEAGAACWIAPRDVVPGESYAGAIVHAIDATKLLVLILSEHGASSKHVLREIERASSKDHPVVAFRIDAASMPADLEYFLNTSQWLDASGMGVEAALPRLVEAVKRVIASPGNARVAQAPSAIPSQQTPVSKAANRRPSLLAIAFSVLVALGLVYLAVDKLWLAKRATEQPSVAAASVSSDKSIAVLPFTDMSEKHDQEYFSDGMSEEIIDLLVKVPGLKVPARTSSFYFKGKSTQIPEIARQLGVANVLEGSVRKSGDHLRVTAQLVRADNGFHIWSETYDRQLDDVFKTQDEIAGAVVSALKVSLVKPEEPVAVPTTNNEAYELYLQARAHVNHESQDEILKGYDELRRAVSLDPKFALAWASLAQMLARDNVNWGLVIRHAGAAAPRDSVDLSGWQATWAQVRDAAREAADKAITLGPELADSHAAKAEVLALLDWNWNAAQAEYQRALQIERNNASIIELAADIPMFLGRLPECLQLARRAAALDPLGHAWATIGFAEQFSGNLNEAAQAFHKSIELYPDGVMVHFRYASALLEQGNTQAALTEFEQESLVPARYIGKAMALDALGRRSEAEAAIAFAEEKWGDAMSYQISYFYAARNDRDRAFAWLERAYRQHDGGLLNLKVDSRFRNLRQDPRYTQLLRRMNLLE